MVSSLTSLSSICDVVILGGEMLSSAMKLALMSVFISWISGFLSGESLEYWTGVFLVWFSRNGSVSDPDTCVEVPFLATFVIPHHFFLFFRRMSLFMSCSARVFIGTY